MPPFTVSRDERGIGARLIRKSAMLRLLLKRAQGGGMGPGSSPQHGLRMRGWHYLVAHLQKDAFAPDLLHQVLRFFCNAARFALGCVTDADCELRRSAKDSIRRRLRLCPPCFARRGGRVPARVQAWAAEACDDFACHGASPSPS
eukprot:2139873-Pyramimonas_sp.AAC.5